MNSSIQKTVFAGIAGTIIMTMVMFIAPLMGLPKMNAAEMLSSMMGLPIAAGWMMHFMIGIVFAFSYSFIYTKFVKKGYALLNGMIFGVAVFVFAQMMMLVMGAIMGSAPKPEGGMLLNIVGSLIGHIMYGIPVVMIAKKG